MKYNQLSEKDKGFYSGIITCLAILVEADKQTLYDEVIGTLDLPSLIAVAKHEEEIEFSGLAKYGYVKS